jgi:hypothetical protein
MRLGKKLAVGEVVEQHSTDTADDTVERPVERTGVVAEAPVQAIDEPTEQPVIAHAEG